MTAGRAVARPAVGVVQNLIIAGAITAVVPTLLGIEALPLAVRLGVVFLVFGRDPA